MKTPASIAANAAEKMASTSRIAVIAVVAAVLFQLLYVCFKTQVIPTLPIEQVYLVASVLGLKGWEKVVEKKGDPKPAA